MIWIWIPKCRRAGSASDRTIAGQCEDMQDKSLEHVAHGQTGDFHVVTKRHEQASFETACSWGASLVWPWKSPAPERVSAQLLVRMVPAPCTSVLGTTPSQSSPSLCVVKCSVRYTVRHIMNCECYRRNTWSDASHSRISTLVALLLFLWCYRQGRLHSLVIMLLAYDGAPHPAAPRGRAQTVPTYLPAGDTKKMPHQMWNCRLTYVYIWLDLINFHFELSGKKLDSNLFILWEHFSFFFKHCSLILMMASWPKLY